MSELPRGWGTAHLSDLGASGEQTVLTGPFGSNLGKEDFAAQGVPVFTIGCLGADGIHQSKLLYVSPSKAMTLATYRLREGDFLFSRMASVGRAGFVPADLEGALFNYHLMRLRLNDGVILPRFFHYFVRGAETVRRYLEEVSRGATRDGINTKLLLQMPVEVPPLAEQRRLVTKIDSLSSKSKRAREQLDHIPRLVEKYKQAVLGVASRGDLTSAWRLRAGITSSWVTTRIGELLADIRYGTAKKCGYDNGAVPVLRIPNVQRGEIVLDDLKRADFDAGEVAKLRLIKGDLLVIRSNGSIDLVGRSAVVRENAEGMLFAGYLIRLRIKPDIADPDFIHLCLQEPEQREIITQTAKSTSGVNNINSDEIKSLRVVLPPLPEQREIVRRVQHAFSWIDRLVTQASSARKLVDRLDQMILAKAFRGELVSQDPNDEPASVLLERLGTERTAAGEKAKPKKRRAAASS